MSTSINIKTKSLGLAIVLTLFFGPLGLFYASISGGLIMSLTPFLLLILIVFGAVAGSSLLLAGSAILLIVFAVSYWIICVIWAATAITNHNNRLIENARQAELLKKINETKLSDASTIKSNIEKTILPHDKKADSDRPTMQEWRKNNPLGSINDYYRIHGVPKSTLTSGSTIQPTIKKDPESSNVLLYVIVVLLIVFVVFLYDKETKTFSFNKISNSIGLSSDQKEIENQIENVYFGLINGAYTEQSLTGTTPENLPFYNSDLSTLMVMGLAPLTMIAGAYSLEPRNIKILKLYDNKADVIYDLVFTDNGKESIKPIRMTLKKIGGNWKLDGQKFLPFEERHSKNKKNEK
jgi:hypothetical protein